MTRRIEFTVPDELGEQYDEARGDVPMAAWIKRALESALKYREPSEPVATGQGRADVVSPSASSRAPGDSAAEKAKRESPPDRRVKPMAQAKQGVRPIPKAGKR